MWGQGTGIHVLLPNTALVLVPGDDKDEVVVDSDTLLDTLETLTNNSLNELRHHTAETRDDAAVTRKEKWHHAL